MPQSQFTLIGQEPTEIAGTQWSLEIGKMIVTGLAPDEAPAYFTEAAIAFDHEEISTRHALLNVTFGTCQLTDLESANGTWINERAITPGHPILLAGGDRLRFGDDVILRVHLDESVAPPTYYQSLQSASYAPLAPIVPSRGPNQVDNGRSPVYARHSQRLINYLPDIYKASESKHQNFGTGAVDTQIKSFFARYAPEIHAMTGAVSQVDDRESFFSRFLALFESVLDPIEWVSDNFALFLAPSTAPAEFWPWLYNWLIITFDETWSHGQKRTFMQDAPMLFAFRGTPWALKRVLEIYTGIPADQITIRECTDDLAPNEFEVILPNANISTTHLQSCVDKHKPAHTTGRIKIQESNG